MQFVKDLKSYKLFHYLDDVSNMHMIAAQPHGCAPIVDAFKNNKKAVIPVENPDTVAKSLAIGDPGDGRYVLKRLVNNTMDLQKNVITKKFLMQFYYLHKLKEYLQNLQAVFLYPFFKKWLNKEKLIEMTRSYAMLLVMVLKATESIMEVLQKPTVMKADIKEISAVVN